MGIPLSIAIVARVLLNLWGCTLFSPKRFPYCRNLTSMPLICTGQLPPSFVEYALRDGAAGVLVASCRDTGCAFRLGARWTQERLDRRREPHLRHHVPAARVQTVQADLGETPVLAAALAGLRQNLAQIKEAPTGSEKIHHA